jgi:hypothetical protein
MAILRHRQRFISFPLNADNSVPSQNIFPETLVPGGRSPGIAINTLDFPLPDSPTSPSVSPRASVNEQSLAASVPGRDA